MGRSPWSTLQHVPEVAPRLCPAFSVQELSCQTLLVITVGIISTYHLCALSSGVLLKNYTPIHPKALAKSMTQSLSLLQEPLTQFSPSQSNVLSQGTRPNSSILFLSFSPSFASDDFCPWWSPSNTDLCEFLADEVFFLEGDSAQKPSEYFSTRLLSCHWQRERKYKRPWRNMY